MRLAAQPDGAERKKLEDDPELLDWFRLAETLGRSLEETQATVSSHEFGMWQAVWHVRGEPDPWQMTSLIAALICGTMGGENFPIDSVVTKIGGREYRKIAIKQFVGAERVLTPAEVFAMFDKMAFETRGL